MIKLGLIAFIALCVIAVCLAWKQGDATHKFYAVLLAISAVLALNVFTGTFDLRAAVHPTAAVHHHR